MKNNMVYIGNKPLMNYVLAVLSIANEGSKNVIIKARGKAISKAVDTAEVAKSRLPGMFIVKSISIDTETLISEQGEAKVSKIEIVLKVSK